MGRESLTKQAWSECVGEGSFFKERWLLGEKCITNKTCCYWWFRKRLVQSCQNRGLKHVLIFTNFSKILYNARKPSVFMTLVLWIATLWKMENGNSPSDFKDKDMIGYDIQRSDFQPSSPIVTALEELYFMLLL